MIKRDKKVIGKIKSRYRIAFYNDNTLSEVWSIKFTWIRLFVLLLLICSLFAFIISVFIVGTPIRTLLPGYMKTNVRVAQIDNNLKLDSISDVLYNNEVYIKNVQKVLSGEYTSSNTYIVDSTKIQYDSLPDKTEIQTEYLKKYDEVEKYNLDVLSPILTEGMIFFNPSNGSKVISNFDQSRGRYYTLISVPRNNDISAIYEGTIIDVNNSNGRYNVTIQHSNNFISKYNGVGEVVKRIGDKVSTGEKIAYQLYGENVGDSSVKIELWLNGTPLNIQDFISF